MGASASTFGFIVMEIAINSMAKWLYCCCRERWNNKFVI